MATNHSPLLVAVFPRESEAKAALNSLKDAGFDDDQIGIAYREHGLTAPELATQLMDLGVPQARAEYYENELKAGHIVLSVVPEGREQEALQIFRSNGGYDEADITSTTGTVDTAGTAKRSIETKAEAAERRTLERRNIKKREAANNAAVAGAGREAIVEREDDRRAMELREEQLRVNKERVQAGEVDLHKRVVAEQQTINVPVEREEVIVERHPVRDGVVDNTPIGTGETISVPVSEEQVRVTKQTVVTGEVEIEKRKVQETQRVTDTVRKEQARLETEGDAPIHDTDTDRFHPKNRP